MLFFVSCILKIGFVFQGDTISAGEALFEVQTDKAVLAFDTEEEGVLAKILVINSIGFFMIFCLSTMPLFKR